MRRLVVGSRESALAVAQSMTLVDYLKKRLPDTEIILKTMKTTGDRILDKTLDKAGGKGLFVKELDRALREKQVDLTVHSLKDVPMEVGDDIPLIGFSKREDPRDAVVLKEGTESIDPSLAIGSSSLRRKLQLNKIFPGVKVEPVRGNINTRLRKLDNGEYGALILAAAGLRRLSLDGRISKFLSTDEMIPAAGQGILAVQGRKDEDVSFLNDFFDEEAGMEALAERGYIKELNGGCTSPVCAFSKVRGSSIEIKGLFYDEETGRYAIGEKEGDRSESEELGRRLADELRERLYTGKEDGIWK